MICWRVSTGSACPALLKARTGGYDGRGNYKIDSPGQAEEAMRRFGDTPLMLERFVRM